MEKMYPIETMFGNIKVSHDERIHTFDCGETGTVVTKILIEVEVDKIWQAHIDFDECIAEQVSKAIENDYEEYLDHCTQEEIG